VFDQKPKPTSPTTPHYSPQLHTPPHHSNFTAASSYHAYVTQMKKTVIVPVTSSSSTTGKPHHLSLKTAAYIVTALSLAEKHKMLADRIDDSALDLDDCLDFH
jgi:hypothetical protein